MPENSTELFIKQTFPNKGVILESKKEKLIPTYRPIETMFAASGKEPSDFQGKKILNVGAGKTHWGFELTKKYGVVAKRFDNLDILYSEQPKSRRLAGKLFAAELVGDIKEQFPFENESYDLLWCSYAPPNWNEFIRVIKPGGEIFVLGGEYSQERSEELSDQLNIPVTCEEISKEKIDLWRTKVSKIDGGAIESLLGKKILVIRKPINP